MAYISQRLPGAGMSNINFLTKYVRQLLSNANTIFSNGGATDLQKHVFRSQTKAEDLCERERVRNTINTTN